MLGSLLVAAVIVWAATFVSRAVNRLRDELAQVRQAQLLTILAPALDEVRRDPAALLAWRRLSDLARTLLPGDAAALDRAAGSQYPFSAADIQDAHARWTSHWLAWERAHDVEFKARVSALQAEAARSGEAVSRAQLDAVDQEKLDRYQQRYAEYVRISKALQALLQPPQ